jgi:hypothetical protein
MITRNNVLTLGILSAVVMVFLIMQTSPGVYVDQVLAQGLIVDSLTGEVYQVYYGQLHSHTTDSDGGRPVDELPYGNPDYAYQYARDIAGLDFFSVADHCSYPYDPDDPTNPYGDDGLSVEEYEALKIVADSYNADGVFVTFWGFEWTSDDASWEGPDTLLGKGHITIINSPDHCEADEPPTNDLNGLVAWMSDTSRQECIAFFNHPGQYGTDFDHFLFDYSEQFVGMELWNRDDDYYSHGWYSNYNGDGSWYDEALSKGWYIGATGSEDNHYKNWGTLTEWRMAVLAQEKTRESIYDAIKARRFYSSRDENLVLSFTCNGAQMGSKIAGGVLDVVIDASDGDGEIFHKIWLIKNGKKIKHWTPRSSNPTVTTTVNGNPGDYFYVIVEQSGEFKWQAISSPIFIVE